MDRFEEYGSRLLRVATHAESPGTSEEETDSECGRDSDSSDNSSGDSFLLDEGGEEQEEDEAYIDREDVGDVEQAVPQIVCSFSASSENTFCLRTLSFWTVPILLISLFVFLYVYTEEKQLHLRRFYIWLPLFVLISGSCLLTTAKAFCLLVCYEDDDEEEYIDGQRDQASALCGVVLCVLIPWLVAVLFGMNMQASVENSSILFIPLMLFPCLMFLGMTLVLCCSDLDCFDRIVSFMLWVLLICTCVTLTIIPLKLQGLVAWKWWQVLAPTFFIDMCVLITSVGGLRKAHREGKGSRCGAFLALLLFWLALVLTKIAGMFGYFNLRWAYAPLYSVGPVLFVSVLTAALVHRCCRWRFDLLETIKRENRETWEATKRIMQQTMNKVDFDDYDTVHGKDDASYRKLEGGDPYIADIETGHSKTSGEGLQLTTDANGLSSMTGRTSNDFSKYYFNGGMPSSTRHDLKESLLKPSSKNKRGHTKLIDQLEHARAAFENARTQDELLGSILDLKELVKNHHSLRTFDLKQALILSGQLKKSKSSFWDKKVALAFGSLVKLFSLTDHMQLVGKEAFSAAKRLF